MRNILLREQPLRRRFRNVFISFRQTAQCLLPDLRADEIIRQAPRRRQSDQTAVMKTKLKCAGNTLFGHRADLFNQKEAFLRNPQKHLQQIPLRAVLEFLQQHHLAAFIQHSQPAGKTGVNAAEKNSGSFWRVHRRSPFRPHKQ